VVTALCVVGNKIDLQNDIKIPTEKGQRLATSFNAAFVESSAKQDIGKDTILSYNVVATYIQVYTIYFERQQCR